MQSAQCYGKGKSPGLDGLTAEVYQVFWDDIGDVLTKVYNEAFEHQEVNQSQKVSVPSNVKVAIGRISQ